MIRSWLYELRTPNGCDDWLLIQCIWIIHTAFVIYRVDESVNNVRKLPTQHCRSRKRNLRYHIAGRCCKICNNVIAVLMHSLCILQAQCNYTNVYYTSLVGVIQIRSFTMRKVLREHNHCHCYQPNWMRQPYGELKRIQIISLELLCEIATNPILFPSYVHKSINTLPTIPAIGSFGILSTYNILKSNAFRFRPTIRSRGILFDGMLFEVRFVYERYSIIVQLAMYLSA